MRVPLKYFLLILAVLPITGFNFANTDEYLILINLIALFSFFGTKQKLDIFIIVIIVTFIIINIVSSLFFGSINFNTLLGFILRLSAPYLIIKVIGKDFLIIYPKFALFMALVSVPFYILQQLNYKVLLNIFSYYKFTSIDIRQFAGKYCLIFHTIDVSALGRNSGFLWEPGGFGYFLGFAIMLLLVKNNFRFNKQVLILIGVGLTTFSTTFYLFIIITALFAAVYSINARSWTILLLPIVAYAIYLVLNQDFMVDKIAKNYDYTESLESNKLGKNDDKLGRMGGFKIEMIEFMNYPLGFGINENGRIKTSYGEFAGGPSGLSHYIARWGIIGLIFLIIALNKFNKFLTKYYHRKIMFYSSFTILLFLFSNPLDREFLLLAFLFLPFISFIEHHPRPAVSSKSLS